MYTLVFIVLFSIIFSFFATINTKLITISFWFTTFQNIPTYLVVLSSLLVGLLLGSLITAINTFFTNMRLNAKNKKIAESKNTIAELTKEVHKLQIENEELKTKQGTIEDQNSM